MDSLTQITLGAALGEFILGKQVGRKAAAWGALAGTIPDLDVFSALFLDPVDYLSVHRGFSHSIFFPMIVAPVLGFFAWNLHNTGSLKGWITLFFCCIITHPFLDLLTGYGTQLLNPFSNYGFELNTIFIIDPLYTLPLLVMLIIALFYKKESPVRRRINKLGIYLSTGYLVLTVFFKLSAFPVFQKALKEQGISYSRMMTIPGPFTSVFWRALVEADDGYYQGYYSLFDKNNHVDFFFIPKNQYLIQDKLNDRAIKQLIWFSKGFYHISEPDGEIYFNDLRFGSYNGWRGDESELIFSFKLIWENGYSSFKQVRNPVDVTADDLLKLFRMMFLPGTVSESNSNHP